MSWDSHEFLFMGGPAPRGMTMQAGKPPTTFICCTCGAHFQPSSDLQIDCADCMRKARAEAMKAPITQMTSKEFAAALATPYVDENGALVDPKAGRYRQQTVSPGSRMEFTGLKELANNPAVSPESVAGFQESLTQSTLRTGRKFVAHLEETRSKLPIDRSGTSSSVRLFGGAWIPTSLLTSEPYARSWELYETASRCGVSEEKLREAAGRIYETFGAFELLEESLESMLREMEP